MKKILFVYDAMILGGSTTSLISLLNNLSPKKYEIDLQLYRNEGPLLNEIPPYVNLLPAAEKYLGLQGKLLKGCKFIFKGYFFSGFLKEYKNGKKIIFSKNSIYDCQAKEFSRKSSKRYDYAIGFLEGWPDLYVSYMVNARKKYAWLHSTFRNITNNPKEEMRWMPLVDKIVFVTNKCLEQFQEEVPEMAHKAIAIENITDTNVIRERSLVTDDKDLDFKNFMTKDCFKIITVCRIIISVKGLDRIIYCAKKLKNLGRKFVWYIIGDGPDKEELMKMVEINNLKEYVYVIGKRMNPYPYIKEADIMCMPSRYEGKPMAITESLILGVPPVVTEYLSANEQIRNFIDGIVVKNNDVAIFEAVDQCITIESFVENLKENIRKFDYGNQGYINEIEERLFLK